MLTCTFFGHRNTPDSIKTNLKNIINELITKQNVTLFYIGNQGNFDYITYITLKKLKKIYPHIKYYVVLAYLPTNKTDYFYYDFSDTIFPDCLTNVPPKFAIYKRNEFMLEKSDFVITYITNNFGGASQFAEKAKRKNKKVINLA